MPLLDLLKTTKAPSPSNSPSGASLAEEWMSLSVAIGLEVDNVLVKNPPNRTVEISHDSKLGVMDSDEVQVYWARLLTICPQDLLDNLVRAYFTISHLRESALVGLADIKYGQSYTCLRSCNRTTRPHFGIILLSWLLSYRYAVYHAVTLKMIDSHS